ncbi:MAG: SMC-Scp complex subunit ScpB [Candidatus Omnitrophica bacterium]|nr:SMC-Scp complex subunit ScpB [Candidatus Omnitrophota bacterium]
MPGPDDLKSVVEALLFASDRPLPPDEICLAFSADEGEAVTPDAVREAIGILKSEYESEGRGFRLCEIAGGFQLMTDPRFAPTLRCFYQAREKKKLSQASLETLSVIAYRQPVAKADVEFVRGVNVDGALKTLLEKELVKVVGRKDVPGRPMLYGTTPFFLEHFGLSSLEELPPLPAFTEKDIEASLLPPELKEKESP